MILIDADALVEWFKARMALWSGTDEVLDEISDAPTIELGPIRRGKWNTTWFDHKERIVCSECECMTDRMTDFCPNCGARMNSEVE